MTNDLFYTFVPILVIGLIGLIFGGLFGYLLAGSQKSAGDKAEKTPGEQYVQAVRVWRDRRSGKLVVDLDGNYYASMDKMPTRWRSSLQETLDDLKFFTGAVNPLDRVASYAQPVETGQVVPSAVMPAVISATGQPGAESHTSFAGLDPVAKQAREEILARAIVQQNLPKEKEKEPEAILSIAAQIDKILQDKLPNTPLRERTIRLMELPEQGMVVMVDGKSFDGVGDVQEDEVRQLIQICVAEWEKTT